MDKHQSFVDPDAIDEMAQTLFRLSHRVKDFDARLEQKLLELGCTYGDASYEDFAEAFQSARQNIRQFVEHTEIACFQLRNDVQHVRIFLEGKAGGKS